MTGEFRRGFPGSFCLPSLNLVCKVHGLTQLWGRRQFVYSTQHPAAEQRMGCFCQDAVVSSCGCGEVAGSAPGQRAEGRGPCTHQAEPQGERKKGTAGCDAIPSPQWHFAMTPQPTLCCLPMYWPPFFGPELTEEADGRSSSGCRWEPRQRVGKPGSRSWLREATSYDGFQLEQTKQLFAC